MNAFELDLYRRVTRVSHELRDGRGELFRRKVPKGMVDRGLVARRLVDELAGWLESHEGDRVGGSRAGECERCGGQFMVPSEDPDGDVMNTPCPECNEFSPEYRGYWERRGRSHE